MILWHHAPGATTAYFKVVGSDPFVGLVLSPLDGRLHDPADLFDPRASLFKSTQRYPVPVTDIFYAFLDESRIPDGTYMVEATSDIGAAVSLYEISIKSGRRIMYTPPPGVTPPPFCVVTGTEIGLDGTGISGVQVIAELQGQKKTGVTSAYGNIASCAVTETDVAGGWMLPLPKTKDLIPETLTGMTWRHYSFGKRTAIDLYIPDTDTITWQNLLQYSLIKSREIPDQDATPAINVPAGYVKITGKVVDAAGKPMASLPVKIGVSNGPQPVSAASNVIPAASAELLLVADSVQRLTTTASMLKTMSAYPGAEVSTMALGAGSELLEVIDGYDRSLKSSQFTYDQATGALDFTAPFAGIVKYRVPSDGKFEAVMIPGIAYWVQVGEAAMRFPFDLYGGITSFDVGEVMYPSPIGS